MWLPATVTTALLALVGLWLSRGLVYRNEAGVPNFSTAAPPFTVLCVVLFVVALVFSRFERRRGAATYVMLAAGVVGVAAVIASFV